jgi:hypothetical protein
MPEAGLPPKVIPETPSDPPLAAEIIKRQLRDQEGEERESRLKEVDIAQILDGS